jgi:hypothetical protein
MVKNKKVFVYVFIKIILHLKRHIIIIIIVNENSKNAPLKNYPQWRKSTQKNPPLDQPQPHSSLRQEGPELTCIVNLMLNGVPKSDVQNETRPWPGVDAMTKLFNSFVQNRSDISVLWSWYSTKRVLS